MAAASKNGLKTCRGWDTGGTGALRGAHTGGTECTLGPVVLHCLFTSPSLTNDRPQLWNKLVWNKAVWNPRLSRHGLSEGFRQRNSSHPPRPYPIFAVAFNRVSARPSCSRSTRPLFLTDDKCCSGRSGTARVPPACGSIQQLMEVQTPALPSACLHRRSCARRHKHMAVIPEG